MKTKQPVRFIIVNRARSGSTMLGNLLNSHPEVRCHGEVLSDQLDGRYDGVTRQSDSERFRQLNDLRNADPAAFFAGHVLVSDRAATGAKILYGDLERPQWAAVLDLLRNDRDIRVIHLVRENRLKRFVSVRMATSMTNVYVAHDRASVPPVPKIRLSPDECIRDFHKTERAEKRIGGYFAEHPLHRVTYESLIDSGEALLAVQRFLGVIPIALEPKTVKIVSDNLVDVIENYAELRDAFTGTEYEQYL